MHSLKTKLSFVICTIVLITVSLISFLTNVFIQKQFNNYILKQQELKKREIVNSLSQQYNKFTNTWDIDFIHTIGMSALYDGYIVKVYDIKNNSVWDAQKHDMTLCAQIMESISERMEEKYPNIHGQFTSKVYHLTTSDETIGSVSIGFFSPYFLSENDFEFLNALNIALISIGVFSLLLSVLIGVMFAGKLSKPILKTVVATKKIASGSYDIRIDEKATTKELDMLISSINHLASSLEHQNKIRKQLTEDVSHELRTPIAVLQSYIEAMIEGVWELTPERLESCNDEIKRLSSLISDLEKLHKVDSDNLRLSKSEINLTEIIYKAVKSFEVKIKENDLNISVSGSCNKLIADENRINQVVINLLSNAIKYTNSGGDIYIKIFETSNEAGFSVTDNGIGIPENELPFIFERFYRADKSRNRKTGGLGLGLAIVKSIVDAHGGKISVESKINKGTRIEVLLPKN